MNSKNIAVPKPTQPHKNEKNAIDKSTQRISFTIKPNNYKTGQGRVREGCDTSAEPARYLFFKHALNPVINIQTKLTSPLSKRNLFKFGML